MVDYDELAKKGWTPEEITKAKKVLEGNAPKSKKLYDFFDNTLYWVAIFLTISINIFVSVIIMPFIIISFNDFRAYFFTMFTSFMFGLFFDLLINNMRMYDKSDAVIEGLFIPSMALINIFFIYQAISLSQLVSINMNVVYISLVIYVIFFIMSYVFGKIAKFLKKKYV